MLQVPELLHVSHIFSELRQVRGCCTKKTEGGLIMRVKRFIEWVHELKIESEKIWTESESSGTSKVNRFGASLPESTGLAKHSRVFETSGLVSEQGLKQGGFKSLKRNSVEGLKFNHKYLKSVHNHSPTGQANDLFYRSLAWPADFLNLFKCHVVCYRQWKSHLTASLQKVK